MSQSFDSIDCTPPDLRAAAESVSSDLLPTKSKSRYERQYEIFLNWCANKNVKSFTENVLVAYFTELVASNKKSLWAIYSMIKSCLKRKTATHVPKKSKVLEEAQIAAFIDQAPDDQFLLLKTALIIGVCGALRREELYKLKIKDVQLKDDIFIILIPETKNNITRSFAITKCEWVAVVQKYIEIRQKNEKILDRFFLKYQNGRCYNSPVGINTIGNIPFKIAKFLSLENAQEYTGHCYRRSSATMLANKGGDLLTLKKHGGWKSGAVAESYVADSLKRKIDVANIISEPEPSTSKKVFVDVQTSNNLDCSTSVIESNQLIPAGLFSKVENSSITVNIYNNFILGPIL